MRTILLGVLFVALIALPLTDCKHVKDETPEADNTPGPDGPHAEGLIVWGGLLDGALGVNRLDAEKLESETLFAVDDMAMLDIALGGEQFLITDSAGGVIFRMLDGFVNATEAVPPATLSPNGRRVLFVRDGDAYETPSAGVGEKLLVAGAARPRFSPDMTLLAYTTAEGFFVEAPGSLDPQPVELSPGGIPQLDDPDPALLPAFSPDGTLVAAPLELDIGEDRHELFMFIIDVAEKTVVTWIGNGRYPSWAENGLVAYESSGLIYVWDVANEINRQLTSNQEVADQVSLFSEDGKYILFKQVAADQECLFAVQLNPETIYPLIDCSPTPIYGADWVRTAWCPEGNTAPGLTDVQVLVDGTPAAEPVTVAAGSTVVARFTVADAECNLAHGIAFASADGAAPRAIGFDFPEGAGCDPESVPVPADYAGDVTLTFSLEDDCGAASAGIDVQFSFLPGDDDTTDDTTADDTTADDTAADDTAGDDTVV